MIHEPSMTVHMPENGTTVLELVLELVLALVLVVVDATSVYDCVVEGGGPADEGQSFQPVLSM